MIISKVERVWTLVVAVLMLVAACAYTIAVSDVVSEQLTVWDICWIYSPAVFLSIYGILLILCYKQRGLKWKQGYKVDVSGYQGNKYPWL